MAADAWLESNEVGLQRLVELTGELTEDDLVRSLHNDITVAVALIHIAFWDEYCRALLQQWETHGFSPTRTAFDAVNAAVQVIGSAVPPRLAPQLAREAAHRIVAQVAVMPRELVETIEAEGYSVILDRDAHWRTHLNQIEMAVGLRPLVV